MNRPLRLALGLGIAGAIYSWMAVRMLHDAKLAVGRRLWPGPPIDYP